MKARALTALRHLGVGMLAGLPVGILVAGVGGRLAMRISGFLSPPELQGTLTEAEEVVGRITFGGSMFLIVSNGGFIGVVGGAIYAAVRPLLAFADRWRGVLYGLVAFALAGASIIDPANFDFRRFGPAWLNVGMFAALFLISGIAVDPLYARIERASRPDRPGGAQLGVAVLVWMMTGLALIALTFIVIANAIQIALGRHAQETILASIVGLLAIGFVIVTVLTGKPWLTRAGYGILLIAVAVGAVRALVGVTQILAG